jgi:hypothetical protein
MGNRRLSRKRLYQVEKLGKKVDLESGAGIEDAIVSATQHRQGNELITEIAIDLAPSGATIASGNGAGKPCSVATKAARITQLTVAKFGNITEYRVVIVEAPSISSSGVAINVALGSATDEAQGGGAIAGHTEINGSTALQTVGQDISLALDTIATHQTLSSEECLYITDDGSNSGDYDAGKILIYLHGFVAPADL